MNTNGGPQPPEGNSSAAGASCAIEQIQVGPICVVSVSGTVDMLTAPQLEAAIAVATGAAAPTAVVVALVHVMLPFMVIPVWTSLQKLDPMVENAALSLGASQWTVMRRVVLPQVTPGLLSGSLIVFALSASALAIPGLLGGRRLKMVATLIYDEYLHELNWPLGAAIALVLLVINLAVMLSYNAVLEGAYKKRMG